MHYLRWKRHGDPLKKRRFTDEEMFWNKVHKTEACWLWLGKVRVPSGYGVVRRNSKDIYAHRYSYELAGNVIPDGYSIHHRCHNRLGVNPHHLQALTVSEHSKLEASLITHCKRGHEFTEENTYLRKDTGARQCRACKTERKRAWDLKQRQNVTR